MGIDETEAVSVECKSRLSQDDVNKLSRFKQTFPYYQNFQAYGAVAGISF